MDKLFDRVFPALRHTRLPLATGFAWLLAAWLAFGDKVPEEAGDKHSASRLFERAAESLGPAGRALALAFVAYLVGSVVSYLLERTWLIVPPSESDSDEEASKNKRKFTDEGHRLLLEGDLRIQFALPLIVAVVALAVRDSPWWLFALAGAGLLMWQGWSLRWEALDTKEPSYEADPSQFSERYSTAAAMLGSEVEMSRTGGILELGRLAEDSDQYRETIRDLLSRFVKLRFPEHLSEQPGGPPESADPAPQPVRSGRPADVDSALARLVAIGGADLRRADLSTADLSTADLSTADLREADLSGSDLSGADLCEADLRTANLRGADLRTADLREADLREADLREADLRTADLRGANLRGADLRGADLRGAHLRTADLREADLRTADLRGAHLSQVDLSGANLREANLSGAHLSWADLNGAHLSEANLSEADLNGAHLRQALLSEANLSGANLSGAHLIGAHLIGANLREAHLIGANLREADLREADLREANLSEADLGEAIWNSQTIWPDEYEPPEGMEFRDGPPIEPD